MNSDVVIGLDPHKASNTIAVLDRSEAVLGRRRFTHSDAGLIAMFGTASPGDPRPDLASLALHAARQPQLPLTSTLRVNGKTKHTTAV